MEIRMSSKLKPACCDNKLWRANSKSWLVRNNYNGSRMYIKMHPRLFLMPSHKINTARSYNSARYSNSSNNISKLSSISNTNKLKYNRFSTLIVQFTQDETAAPPHR